jgi:hypothetical protein
MLCQPLPGSGLKCRNIQLLTVRNWHMGERNHPILPALPHRDRDLDAIKVESPGLYEGEVVVAPPIDALPD